MRSLQGNLRPRPEWPAGSRICLPWPFSLKLEEKYVKSLILNVFLTKELNFLGKIIKLSCKIY